MTRKAVMIAVGIMFFVPIGVFAKMQAKRDIPLHHFDMPCASCHEPALAVSTFEADGGAEPGPVRGNINQLCTASGCHDFAPLLTHPTGVVRKSEIPSDMALDRQSRLTCLTCHTSGNESDSPQTGAVESQRMLRVPQDESFCAKCHSKMSGAIRTSSHWQFSTRAHLGSADSQSPAAMESVQFAGGIDSESHTCLSCHDDVLAYIPSYGPMTRSKAQFGRGASDHPIGMDYEQAASRREGRFSFMLTAERRIRLFEGKVGCGSCHSLYAKTSNLLVEPFERDVLCKKCHLL